MSSGKTRRSLPAGKRARGPEPCPTTASVYPGGLSEDNDVAGVVLAMLMFLRRLKADDEADDGWKQWLEARTN